MDGGVEGMEQKDQAERESEGGARENIWEETTKIKGCLRGSVKT